mgnify:CR=1 FL=1
MAIKVYNTLTKQKEEFIPKVPGKASMYVCGVTPYNHPHIGNARPFVTWDVIRRFLEHEGYDVMHVQNFTDVDDKIINSANKEGVQWFDICNRYIDSYFEVMDKLNVRRAHVYPRVSEHMDDIIKTVQTLIDNGYGYVIDGDVYYSVEKFERYGELSGRNIEETLENTRELDGQDEKHHSVDFALWKKAQPEHIMHWPSPWSEGFPGWHLECSTMSTKYLGNEFDIHGGGMDLMFPHHECEIAQSTAALGHESVHYWMHNNMITIDGKKMGKSYGNFITLDEFFQGTHPKLTQAYSPMTIRFFILMAHYRSTVDFGNEALQSAEKGMKRMNEGFANISRIKAVEANAETEATNKKVAELEAAMYEAMNDDLTTPIVISNLFELVSLINKIIDGQAKIDQAGLEKMTQVFKTFLFDILGMKDESVAGADNSKTDAYKGAVDLLLEVRAQAKANKDWATSDLIRNKLAELGFVVKDTKDGATWTI